MAATMDNNPARGCLIALAIAAVFWAALIMAVVS
jgi:hypothetical protein